MSERIRERTPPPRREDFPKLIELQTRWADNDAYGHMNNVVHYALFDTVVNRWLVERGLLDLKGGGSVFLVVETACRYHAELAFPEPVTAGLRVERLGSSSIRYHIALFGAGETACADGTFVHVHVDRATRRPLPLDERQRAILGEIA